MGTTNTSITADTPASEVVQDALQSTKLALQAGQKAIEDISQMQQKVERSLDWRSQVTDRPWLMLGVAALGGLMLASLFGGHSRD